MTNALTFPRTAAAVPALLELARVDSTNSVLKSLDASRPYTTVLSTHQVAGRGRKDRQWWARSGESLALSTVVPAASLSADKVSWIPLIAGLAAIRSLSALGLTEATLKWPNDVRIGDKKLAGILCRPSSSSLVVVGVGINLFFEAEPPVPHATSIGEHLSFSPSLPDLWASNFLLELQRLSEREEESSLRAVSEVMDTLGRRVEVTNVDGARWSGYAQRLGSNGCLIVRDAEGREREVVAADIEHLYQ